MPVSKNYKYFHFSTNKYMDDKNKTTVDTPKNTPIDKNIVDKIVHDKPINEKITLAKTPLEKTQELISQIDKFKVEIAEHRQFLKTNIENDFVKYDKDEEYKLLLEKGDLTSDDEELENLPYPYRKTRRQREEEAEEYRLMQERAAKGFDWDDDERKTFVRDALIDELQNEGEDPTAPPVNRAKKIAKDNNSAYIEMLKQPRKDFEQMVGEGLISKVGVLLITIGIFTLLNLAGTEGFLNEYVRMLLGMGIALGMLFAAHRMRQTNETFSSLFVYGSIAVFYYTTYLGYYEYRVINQATAFFLDTIITLAALGMAVLYDRKNLAILGLVGAYATPFIVNADEDFSNTLFFSYILMMNIFMALVANYKKWQFINLIIFAVTIITFDGWIHQPETDLLNSGIFSTAIIFATLYYIFFFALYVAYTWRHGEQVYFPLVINTVLCFYTVFRLLYEHETLQADLGSYTFLFGFANAIFTAILLRTDKLEERLINHVAGFAVFMITLAIIVEMYPAKHEYNRYLAIEAVIFLGFAYYSGLQILRNGSAIVMLMAFATLFINWYQTYSQAAPVMFFNEAVFSTLITVASAIISAVILQKDTECENIIATRKQLYMGIVGGVAGILIYLIGNVELEFHNYEIADVKRLWIGIYNSCFILALWLVGNRIKVPAMKKAADYLVAFSAALYILYVHFSVVAIRDEYLMQNQAFGIFAIHYINVALSVGMVLLMITDIYKKYGEHSSVFSYLIWYVVFILMFHASAELEHTSALLFYEQGQELSELLYDVHRLPYSILWTLAATFVMYLGMRYKLKDLRMISLAIFALMLIKFFVLDFRDISATAKVLSLMFLGGVMLVVSFMYTQVKKVVLEGEIVKNANQIPMDREARFEAPREENKQE